MNRALAITALALAARTADADDDELRSPTVATWLSLGVTAAGAAVGTASWYAPNRDLARVGMSVGAAAFVVGPSVGHWYGGNFREGPGGWLRASGLALGFAGVFVLAAECDDDDDCPVRQWPVAAGMFGFGGALFVAGAAYDIATAADEARRYNNNRNAWSLAPFVPRGGAGLTLAGRF